MPFDLSVVLGAVTDDEAVMMYTRAAASDYDDWEKEFNNPGWGSKEIIPLIKKVGTLERRRRDACLLM